MQFGKILVLLGIAAIGAAENNVEADDVPSACLPACQFTIDLSARCDRETDDDDGYRPCVCGAANSQQRLTECASCVKDHGRSDPDDNDVADLMDDCGWDFNDADVPYPTTTSTTVANPSSTGPSGTVTMTETPSNTPSNSQSETPTSGTTTTVTESPASATSQPGSMAGALNAKAVVGPLLAGLLVSLPIIL